MPRYSYVVAFPVLIALCIGVNIQRYPAVSTMLRGEPVESRWLGRSEVFDFQAKQPAESKSYQGYRSGSDEVADSRAASREPIPLSDSLTIPSASPTPSRSSVSSYSTPVPQPSRSSQSNSTSASIRTNTNPTDASATRGSSFARDSYSYQNDSYENRPNSNVSSGRTDIYTSLDYDNTHASGSDMYGDSYRASSFPAWNDDRTNYNVLETRNDNVNGVKDRSESRSSSDNRYSLPDYNHSDRVGGGTFRMDSPLPGYSSRFPADEVISTPDRPTDDAIPATIMETQPAAPQVRRPLSPQEKLELRLATPFSLSQPDSQGTSSDQYIPPDFLPPHENGIVTLIDPFTEPVVKLSPITFISEMRLSVSPEATTTSPSETKEDGMVEH